ncbi:MAG TPA: type VI secretion system baseplate subunit TssK [Dyella sp.]|nr:type VI secretion system baseplate subunit TssK [Dyella sp.]
MSAVADNLPTVPEAVSWSEGMLLSPQHFQQNDIYWNALVRHQMSMLQPYYWGVLSLSIKAEALGRKCVEVESLRCVMHDGLIIEYPGHFGSQELKVQINDEDFDGQDKVVVQLSVPIRGKGAASGIGDMQRYVTVTGNLETDENTGKDEIEVERMRPKISLIKGKSVAACYCALPLLEVSGGSGGLRITPYHPPMLRLSASAFQGEASLRQTLKLLSGELWRKYRELLGVRVDDRGEPRYDGESNMQIVAARYLVMGLPRFDVMLQNDASHPYDLYVALSELVGFVAATPGAPQPPSMKAFEHGDCMPQFQEAINYVRTQLARMNADYRIIEFEKVGASGFLCQLPGGIDTSSLLIELRPRAGEGAQTLGRWIDNAHVASKELIYLLVQRRYPGATVHPASDATVAAMNLRKGAFVYEIANGHIHADDNTQRPLITEGRTLMILGEPDDHVPAAISLYLPRRAPRSGSAGTG